MEPTGIAKQVMEPTGIAKQVIDLQKTAFDNAFKAMVMLQEQTEKMTRTSTTLLMFCRAFSSTLRRQPLQDKSNQR